MNLDKVIHIKCEAKSYYQLDELNHFQGKLKSIDQDDFDKLKKSLVKDGLPIGFHVWIDKKNKVWTIDGHHRVLALKALRDDGYDVPSLPCVHVQAKDKKEAAKAVLINNSKYAKINQDSLSDFMIDFELNLDDLNFLDLPVFDLGNIIKDDKNQNDDNDNDNDKEVPEDLKKQYSDKIATPIYSPKKNEAPNISELFSIEKYNELIKDINNKDLPKEIKTFLICAASRHISFNYENIAEFYCHQNKSVQDLMEKSALIIIDFNKAVENGFVRLTEELNDIYENQQKDIDTEGE